MNFARYLCMRTIHAAKIEIVHPVERSLSVSVRRLTVRDAADQMRDVELRGSQIPEYGPEPGDYYVVDDTGTRIVPKGDFEFFYVRKP